MMVCSMGVCCLCSVRVCLLRPFPQASFSCPSEPPLSPSQLAFLSQRSLDSELFKSCNQEFKDGIR